MILALYHTVTSEAIMLGYDDCQPETAAGPPGHLRIDRVYRLDWDRFESSDWQKLSQIYQALPGAVRYLDLPYWFGENEGTPPFLSACVEPPGLQVFGILSGSDWRAWDEAFQTLADGLPSYEVG